MLKRVTSMVVLAICLAMFGPVGPSPAAPPTSHSRQTAVQAAPDCSKAFIRFAKLYSAKVNQQQWRWVAARSSAHVLDFAKSERRRAGKIFRLRMCSDWYAQPKMKKAVLIHPSTEFCLKKSKSGGFRMVALQGID